MGRIGNEKKSTPIKWCDVHGLVVLERYKRTVAAGCCQMGIRGQKNLEYTRARFWAQTPPRYPPGLSCSLRGMWLSCVCIFNYWLSIS